MSTFEEPSQSQIPEKPVYFQKIRNIWLKYEEKIILAVGIVMIAAIAFEAGFLLGGKNRNESVLIQKNAGDSNLSSCQCEEKAIENTEKKQEYSVGAGNKAETESKNCAFVASKNSNKFHLSTCQSAQKIKPENKVCFSSVEEAQGRGFQGAKCCIK